MTNKTISNIMALGGSWLWIVSFFFAAYAVDEVTWKTIHPELMQWATLLVIGGFVTICAALVIREA